MSRLRTACAPAKPLHRTAAERVPQTMSRNVRLGRNDLAASWSIVGVGGLRLRDDRQAAEGTELVVGANRHRVDPTQGSSILGLPSGLGVAQTLGLSGVVRMIRGMAYNFLACDREQSFLMPSDPREWYAPELHSV